MEDPQLSLGFDVLILGWSKGFWGASSCFTQTCQISDSSQQHSPTNSTAP